MLVIHFWGLFFFPLLAFLGAQTYVWWYFDASEPLSLCFFGAALWFSARSVLSKQKSYLWDICFVVTAAILSLSKEVYIVMIPALILIKIMTVQRMKRLSWRDAIRRNLLLAGALAAIMLSEIFFVVSYVGLKGTGYSGLDTLAISGVLKANAELWTLANGNLFLVCLVLMLLFGRKTRSQGPTQVPHLLPYVLLCAAIVIPCSIVYSKSGILARYVLPAGIGYAFLIVTVYERLARSAKFLITMIAVVAIVSTLGTRVNEPTVYAKQFVSECNEWEAVSEIVTAHTRSRDTAVVVAEPARDCEFTCSVKHYLNGVANIPSVYLYGIGRKSYSDFQKHLVRYVLSVYGDYVMPSKGLHDTKVRTVIVFPGLEATFLNSRPSWFTNKDYRRFTAGRYVVYAADGRGSV